MKLSGFNYKTDLTILDQDTLVLGFATSQKPFGFADTNLVSFGFACNCQDDTHTHNFMGGYKYVENGKDVYGELLAGTLSTALKAKKSQSGKTPLGVIIF